MRFSSDQERSQPKPVKRTNSNPNVFVFIKIPTDNLQNSPRNTQFIAAHLRDFTVLEPNEPCKAMHVWKANVVNCLSLSIRVVGSVPTRVLNVRDVFFIFPSESLRFKKAVSDHV